jgi:hypothetical protein
MKRDVCMYVFQPIQIHPIISNYMDQTHTHTHTHVHTHPQNKTKQNKPFPTTTTTPGTLRQLGPKPTYYVPLGLRDWMVNRGG